MTEFKQSEESKRTVRGLILEMKLSPHYEEKKAAEEAILNMFEAQGELLRQYESVILKLLVGMIFASSSKDEHTKEQTTNIIENTLIDTYEYMPASFRKRAGYYLTTTEKLREGRPK